MFKVGINIGQSQRSLGDIRNLLDRKTAEFIVFLY